ncbi:MAG: hypothetical protein AAF415_13065 [Pseudomonadota bacterium]
MNSADPNTSERLQRVLKLLRAGGRHTTRAIVRKCGVCAVNAIIAELRDRGFKIDCDQEIVNGKRRWFYELISEPETADG